MSDRDLFLTALEIDDLEQRAQFLIEQCGADHELRARVEALLVEHNRAVEHAGTANVGELGDPGATSDGGTAELPRREEHTSGVIAGKYALVEMIGEGGMGSVWRAKQTEPVKRFVAVKLIKAGMDSRQVLARFEAERQALALMDHPNIAKVLDGGLHEHRPFFVMELVKGVPITEYCDANRLTPQQRLELFVPVCNAIQHAHQKGIIHRDIKPSNVLVALYDDKPVVKVIDFGVAKATGAALTEQTIDTGIGGIVGTPQYMSPEQATFNNLDIDTRSDVYALGVLLYELLTGTPPFSGKELQKKGQLEILRVVREEEPPRPSTKLSTADALPSISANRGTEPKKLTGLLRNELDWIVMKSLEKDRTRRYATANGFAADVQRYLAGEAVLAHPPSRGYRIKKFVKRNKGQVLAASLVFFALLAGIVGTTLGLIEARRQRDVADKARKAEEVQRQVAEAQSRRASTVARFLTETLGGAAPAVARGRDTTLLRDMVTGAVQRLDQNELADNPEAEIELRLTVGKVFRDLADYPQAEHHFRRAVALAAATHGPADPRTSAVEIDLVSTLFSAGRYPECLALAEKVREVCVQRGEAECDLMAQAWSVIGSSKMNAAGGWTAEAQEASDRAVAIGRQVYSKSDPKLGFLLRQSAALYYAHSAYTEALPLAQEAYDIYRASGGAQNSSTIYTGCTLADCQLAIVDFAAAEKLMTQSLPDAEAVYGPDHPAVANVLWRLGTAISNRGDAQSAEKLHSRCMEIRRATHKGPHKDVATALSSLAEDRVLLGNPASAEPLFREAVEMRRTLFGPASKAVASALTELGSCLRMLNRLDEAEKTLNEALETYRVTMSGAENHPEVLFELAMIAQAKRNFPRAIDLFGQIVEINRRRYGPSHMTVARTLANSGSPKFLSGDVAGAEADYREAQTIARKAGPTHPTAVLCLRQLQFLLEMRDDWAGAEPLGREAVEVQRMLVGVNHPQYASALIRLGNNLVSQKKYDEATTVIRKGLVIREKALPDSWLTFNTQSILGGVLLRQKKYAEAEPLLVKGYEGTKAREKTIPRGGETRIPEALDRLIELYTATEKPDEVQKYLELRTKYPELAPTPRPKK